jgi:hypothetical protein
MELYIRNGNGSGPYGRIVLLLLLFNARANDHIFYPIPHINCSVSDFGPQVFSLS